MENQERVLTPEEHAGIGAGGGDEDGYAGEYDYSDTEEEPQNENLHSRIAAQCSKAATICQEARSLLKRLEGLKSQFDHVTKTVLPELLKEGNMKEFHTLDGLDVKLKEVTTGSFPSATKAAEAAARGEPEMLTRRVRIMRWLDANGYGHLIQREVSVHFDKSVEGKEKAERVTEVLKKIGVSAEKSFFIHPATFNKFCREALEQGKELPEEFRINKVQVAQLPSQYKVKWGSSSDEE